MPSWVYIAGALVVLIIVLLIIRKKQICPEPLKRCQLRPKTTHPRPNDHTVPAFGDAAGVPCGGLSCPSNIWPLTGRGLLNGLDRCMLCREQDDE